MTFASLIYVILRVLINFVFIISRLEFCPFIVTWLGADLATRDTNMWPGGVLLPAF